MRIEIALFRLTCLLALAGLVTGVGLAGWNWQQYRAWDRTVTLSRDKVTRCRDAGECEQALGDLQQQHDDSLRAALWQGQKARFFLHLAWLAPVIFLWAYYGLRWALLGRLTPWLPGTAALPRPARPATASGVIPFTRRRRAPGPRGHGTGQRRR